MVYKAHALPTPLSLGHLRAVLATPLQGHRGHACCTGDEAEAGFSMSCICSTWNKGRTLESKPVQLVPERTWVLPPQNTCFSLLCQRLWGLPHPWGFSKPCILAHLESLKSICVRHLLIGHLLYAGHCAGPVLLARKYILYLILTDNAKLLKATNSSSFNIFWNIAIKDNGYGWRTLNIYDKIWKDYILHS